MPKIRKITSASGMQQEDESETESFIVVSAPVKRLKQRQWEPTLHQRQKEDSVSDPGISMEDSDFKPETTSEPESDEPTKRPRGRPATLQSRSLSTHRSKRKKIHHTPISGNAGKCAFSKQLQPTYETFSSPATQPTHLPISCDVDNHVNPMGPSTNTAMQIPNDHREALSQKMRRDQYGAGDGKSAHFDRFRRQTLAIEISLITDEIKYIDLRKKYLQMLLTAKEGASGLAYSQNVERAPSEASKGQFEPRGRDFERAHPLTARHSAYYNRAVALPGAITLLNESTKASDEFDLTQAASQLLSISRSVKSVKKYHNTGEGPKTMLPPNF